MTGLRFHNDLVRVSSGFNSSDSIGSRTLYVLGLLTGRPNELRRGRPSVPVEKVLPTGLTPRVANGERAEGGAGRFNVDSDIEGAVRWRRGTADCRSVVEVEPFWLYIGE